MRGAVHVWAHDASRVLPSRSRLVVLHDELIPVSQIMGGC
jgi:hypothetical protein